MNRNEFLRALLFTGAAYLVSPCFGEPEPEYPTTAPTVEADQVLSFTWDDVDKYPLTKSMAFIPSKNALVTGGDDCQLCLWNLENASLEKHFRADDDWIRSLAISSDGKTLAALGHNGSVKLWNTDDWKLSKNLSKLPSGAESIDFSPDDTRIAICGFENQAKIFDAKSGSSLHSLPMPGTGNTIIKFSPDGKYLAAAGRNGIVRVWDAASLQQLKDFRTDGRRIRALAFSMDGTLLAAGGESSSIFVWDTASGQKKQTIDIGAGKTFSLIFCGNDILASGDSLNSIRIWNLADATEIGRCIGHTGTVAVMHFDLESGHLLSGGFDTTVRFWPFMKQ